MNQAVVLKILKELDSAIDTIKNLGKTPETEPYQKALYKGQISGMEYAIRTIKRGLDR